ncbi:MAG: hypothetical protein ACLP01_07480 [Solirubrobacteraceae bacterium]
MSDDWRLRVELASERQASELAELLRGGDVEHQLDNGFAERVIVSLDGVEVFVYTGSREQTERSADAIRALATQHGWRIDEQLARWHPVAEAWEDPEKPLPQDDAAVHEERGELIEQERAESSAVGYPEWEVRVECDSHRATVALDAKLRAEGLTSVRRWRYLLVGAPDEDSAKALAERLRGELPQDTVITVEEQAAAVDASRPFNPFALLGGLGG